MLCFIALLTQFELSAFYLTLLALYLLSTNLFYKKGYQFAFTVRSFKSFRAVYYRLTCTLFSSSIGFSHYRFTVYLIFKLLCKAPHHPSVDSRYPLLSTHALRSSQFDVIALIHFVLPVYLRSLIGFSLLLSYPLL